MHILPAERSPQAIIVERIGSDAGTQHVLDRLLGKELRHQIQLAVAETQAVEHEGHCGSAHAYVLAIPRFLLVQPSRYPDFPADLRHDPQMRDLLQTISKREHICWLSDA